MKTIICLLLLVSPVLSQSLVITPAGYWQLTIDSAGIPILTPFESIISMGDPTNPDPNPNPIPPRPTTLSAKVSIWSTEVDEPRIAEAQGLMMQLVAQQGARGTFGTKARMAAFTKQAIDQTLDASQSEKKSQWLAMWDEKVWPEVRRLEASGQMTLMEDQVRVWNEISVGFKSSTNANWSLEHSVTVTGETTLNVKGEASPFLELLLKLLMQFLLEWLSGNPFGGG